MSSPPLSSEVKDLSIKLFGTMISMPLQCSVSTTHSFEPVRPFSPSPSQDTSARDQDSSKVELIIPEQDDGASPQITEDLKSPTCSGVYENPKTKALSPSAERDDSVLKSSKYGEQSETSTQQEKTPKKPDKILPCPRCNSMETKFCYFNNYNVNQPRHFCKNCQRYWTAGGTMRNVPVGAGRRKNRSSCSSHYRHIVIPESLVTIANANGLRNNILKNGATVLTFGSSDSAICDSVASVLNLAENIQNGDLNRVRVSKQNITVFCSREYNGDDHSVGAITTSTSSEKKANVGSQESVNKTYEGFPPQLQCIPGSPWQSPWNSLVPPPPALSPGYPVSSYPTPAYWGCALPGSLNIACVSPQSSVKNPSPRSSSYSPTSRKHLRDGSIITQANSLKKKPGAESKDSENGVLIPKALRIDDPTEAAKSSICSTLGIKNEKASSLNGCVGLFKAIPSKGNNQNHHHMVEVLPVLQANPAALSRSGAFHEQQA